MNDLTLHFMVGFSALVIIVGLTWAYEVSGRVEKILNYIGYVIGWVAVSAVAIFFCWLLGFAITKLAGAILW